MANKFDVAVMLDVDGTIAPFYRNDCQPCSELQVWHRRLTKTLQHSSHVSINTGRSRSEICNDKNLTHLSTAVNWSLIACSGGSGIYAETGYIEHYQLKNRYEFDDEDFLRFGSRQYVRLKNGASDEDAFNSLRLRVRDFLSGHQVTYPPQAQDSLKICISTDSPQSAEKTKKLLCEEFKELITNGIFFAANKNFIDITLGSKASSFQKISEIISNAHGKKLHIVYCGDASNDKPVRDIILNEETTNMFFVNQSSGHDPQFHSENIGLSYSNRRIIIPHKTDDHYVAQVICGINQAYRQLQRV